MKATVEMAAATHRGRLRAENEDSIAADPRSRLAVVADGMGGHNAGEVASRMAVEVIVEGVDTAAGEISQPLDCARAEMLIRNLIARANRHIHNASRARHAYAGMGTTVVVCLWYDGNVSVGHVGDSRMYRLRSGILEQLTRDHTLVQEQVERGTLSAEAAREAPIRSVLTRAVGSEPEVAADLATHATSRDDVYLLCSDGLTEMLTDREIRDVLVTLASRIDEAAEALVQKANARGGVDNISVVLVRITGEANSAGGRTS